MSQQTAEVVICGAGIAGISVAYYLTTQYGVKNVVLVDERAPMTLTSDKSTECYRNWWPGPGHAMVSLMNRSIDLIEAVAHTCDNRINLNRRGYVYATANPNRIETFKQTVAEAAALGAGPVRYHTGQGDESPYQPAPPHGFENQPSGADLITDQALIKKYFPYLAEDVVAIIHARRCGWFSGQQLGMVMLETAQAHGASLIEGRVTDITIEDNKITGVQVAKEGEDVEISTNAFVNAAGPFVPQMAQMMGLDLPIFSELHIKWHFNDHLQMIPRTAPFVIWADPQKLNWSPEEAEFLAESKDTRWLLDEFPAGAHTRPEGEGDSPMALLLWDYHINTMEPVLPIPIDPDFPEVVLRGVARLIPGLNIYIDRMPKPNIDGGYYTKTKENRPLTCPLSVAGAYLIGALSGFGIMAAPACGELLAAYITNNPLPAYAPAFDLARYDDPDYQALLENWGESGQL